MLNWNSWSVNCRFVGCPGQRRALYCMRLWRRLLFWTFHDSVSLDWGVWVVGERDFSRWLLDCCVMCTRGICTRIYGGFKFPPPQPPTSSHNQPPTHHPPHSLSIYLGECNEVHLELQGSRSWRQKIYLFPTVTWHFISSPSYSSSGFAALVAGFLVYYRRKTRTTTTLE